MHFFNWLVSAIVTAASILPTYFRAGGGAGVLLRMPTAREAPPGSSRTCGGAGRRGACFGCVSSKAESRNKVAVSLPGLGGREGYDQSAFVPSHWTSHPGSPLGVTCVLPAVLEPVS